MEGLARRRTGTRGVRFRVAADAVTSAYINDLAAPAGAPGPRQAPRRLLARRSGAEASGRGHARMPRPGRSLAQLEA
jgi:hypothetical protein